MVQCNVMSQCGDGQTSDEVNLFLTQIPFIDLNTKNRESGQNK